MLERWGSFSVVDHKAADKLVTDVLTYDRLVFPFPPDETERQRWRNNGWQPELLGTRLDMLGELAIKVPWDKYRRDQFSNSMQRVAALAADAETAIPTSTAYQLTRRILAQDDKLVLPRGVAKVVAVSAFHSLDDLKTEFLLDEDRSDPKLLSVLVHNRVAQPRFSEDPDSALKLAVALSRDAEFRAKRRALYEWQESVIQRGIAPGRAMEGLEDLIDQYNELVRKADQKVTYRLIFTVIAVGLTVAGPLLAGPLASIPFALAAASSGVQLVRFASLDRSAVIQAGEAAPAAMFHQIDRH
jgi:hypothetical protein